MKIFVKGGQWSNSEDQLLLAFVRNHGLNSWGSIAASITRKTSEQCKQRWEEFLDPNINKGEWSIAEKEMLLEIYEVFPDQWTTIATYLERRRPWQCQEQLEKMRGGSGMGGEADDAAQEDSGAVSSAASGLKVFHEMREAKKDRVDGDEYEEHMMELGRARLANQAGRKDFRKEKKKEEEHTRAIATLQRKNEMASAGVATLTQERRFSRALQEDKKFLAGEKREREGDEEEDADNDATTTFRAVKMSEVLGSKTKGTAVRAAVEKGRRDLLADHVVTQQEAWKNNSLLPHFDMSANGGAQNKMLGIKGPGTLAIAPPLSSNQLQSTADNDFVADLLGGFDDIPASSTTVKIEPSVANGLSSVAIVDASEQQEEEEDMFADLPEPVGADLPESVGEADVSSSSAAPQEGAEQQSAQSPVQVMSRYESRVAGDKLLKMARTCRWKMLEMEYSVPRAEVLASIRGARALLDEELRLMGSDDCLDHRLVATLSHAAVSQDVICRSRLDELSVVGDEWKQVPGVGATAAAVSVPPGTYSGLLGQKSEMASDELVGEWTALRQRLIVEQDSIKDLTGYIANIDRRILNEEKLHRLNALRSEKKEQAAEHSDVLQLVAE